METFKLANWLLLLNLFLITFHGLSCNADSSQEEELAVEDSDQGELDEQQQQQQSNVAYKTPTIEGQYLYESFDDPASFGSKWTKSASSKADSTELKYDGEWDLVETQPPIKGILLSNKMIIFLQNYRSS